MTGSALDLDHPSLEEPPCLLLIGHGTRAPEGVSQFENFATLVAERAQAAGLDIPATAHGFLEFAEPDVASAIDELVRGGASRIVAVPTVLLAAGHLKNDGPALLAEARRHHRKVTFSYARDLGVNPATLEVATDLIFANPVLAERLLTAARDEEPALDIPPAPSITGRAAVSFRVGPAGEAVCLIGRGSTDPDANADLFKVARLLCDGRGLPLVEPGFVSLAPPSVTDVLDRLLLIGAKKIAVVPYFLFEGLLADRIAEQANRWAEEHPEVVLACSPPMGPDIRLASLVLERYMEAAGGKAAMNCDCCIYRSAMPGYEHRHLSFTSHHPADHRH
jgi:sirohydrochlorin ferrochelatase